MAEPPRRWRFQIHLSTAIVLMFVAGGLLFVNLHPRYELVTYDGEGYGESVTIEIAQEVYAERGKVPSYFRVRRYGWPVECVETASRVFVSGGKWHDVTDSPYRRISTVFFPYGREDYNIKVIVDCAVSLLIIFTLWFLCEWPIRRRAARKGA
ncbi:MAG TPA: hypothetical protein VKX17_19385 [Planctomycetota bacterium]|nr:hypothetical protein [Planctomycetota bacterium]